MPPERPKRPAARRAKRATHDLLLPQLHRVLQLASEWYDDHLHSFTVGDTRYAVPDDDDFDAPAQNSLTVRLRDLDLVLSSRFTYEYDVGDAWLHTIVVRAITPSRDADRSRVPDLVAGQHAAPPEDCGGPPGYAQLIGILGDSSRPEHAEMRLWAGPGFDPARFDARAVKHALIMTAMWGALG